jgi:tRNA (uracil-5-)-methyltransferase TRM9
MLRKNYTRYNGAMNPAVKARLIAINRDFYERCGLSFSATRQRIQPGVRQMLATLKGDESLLDLGCGNGELAHALAKRGYHGAYLGLDFSLSLLKDAEIHTKGFSAIFRQVDLTTWTKDEPFDAAPAPGASQGRRWKTDSLVLAPSSFDVVFCFAVLHHIPSDESRLGILEPAHQALKPHGRLILSNWQFLNSERLKARIQPWKAAGVSPSDVEPGDYLLDWRAGTKGLRYVHHFSEQELSDLARQAGFQVSQSFYSDGKGGKLGLYQIWDKK